MVKKIILVFKTHVDIGFTDLAKNVVLQYGDSMIKDVIETCRATRHLGDLKYVWTMPAWPLYTILKNSSEEERKAIEELIQNEQIVWHALPFTSHTDVCSEEEYIEGIRYARELSAKYQKPFPVAGKMTDVPGHGWVLPALLKGAGIEFLHLGCNEFATPPEVPFLFKWRAKSGEEVVTMYNKGGYGTALTIPEDWDFPVWLALMQTHDNCGPQSVEMIQKMVQSIHEKYPEAEVVCGTMDNFYNELKKCDLSNVPVIDKDLADTWIHGVGAYPTEVAKVRAMRRKSKQLQGVLLQKWRADEELNVSWEEYYEQICLFEEHTWGADVKTWLGPERVYEKKEFQIAKQKESYQFMEESWREQSDRVSIASAELDKIRIAIEEKEDGKQYIIHTNFSPYTGWVRLRECEEGDVAKGVVIAREQIPTMKMNGAIYGYVQNLASGVSVEWNWCDVEEQSKGLLIEENGEYVIAKNHRYQISFSKNTGEVTELRDYQNDEILLESKSGVGVFEYQYHRYGIEDVTKYLKDYGYRYSTWGIQDYGREAYPECKHKKYVPKFTGYTIQDTTITLQYMCDESHEKYGDAQKIALKITLPPAGEEVMVNLRLENKAETPYIESGSLIFPYHAKTPEYILNKSGALLNPKKDINAKANHVLYCLEDFMAISGDKSGVCIIPEDTPLMSIGETGIYHYRTEYEEPKKDAIYFNLFNNMWGTNFPQWTGGNVEYQFTLFGYKGEEEENLFTKVKEKSTKAMVTSAFLSKELPKGLENMQLLYANQSEEGMLIRLKNLQGKAVEKTLELAGTCITEVDLNNEPSGEKYEEKIEFLAKPYGVHSFLLQKMNHV